MNKTSDALTQLATRFTASEIGFVKRVLDYMFDTNNTPTREVMAIKHTQASQLARPGRRARQSQVGAETQGEDGETQQTQAVDAGISIPEADAVLDTLVNEAFMAKSRAGYFSLAPRALIELTSYLKDTYNESAEDAEDEEDAEPVIRIRDCEGCREVVTYGIRCNNRECGVRWHDGCANGFFRARAREQRKCPKCGEVCGGDVFVGERADRIRGRESRGGE